MDKIRKLSAGEKWYSEVWTNSVASDTGGTSKVVYYIVHSSGIEEKVVRAN